MTRLVGYTRVSVQERALLGVSLDAQAASIQAYCKVKGFELVKTITDPGISAGKPLDTRPGGSELLEIVHGRKADGVAAYKLDRLFRDAGDCLSVTQTWDKHKIALHLIDLGGQAVDTTTALGRFFLTVMAGAAEMERNLIRERTRAGMAYKKKHNERVGAIPFGYRLSSDGVHLTVDPGEQRTVLEILRLRERGDTISWITDYLQEYRARFKPRGAYWHETTVRRIVAREARATTASSPDRGEP